MAKFIWLSLPLANLKVHGKEVTIQDLWYMFEYTSLSEQSLAVISSNSVSEAFVT